MMMTIPSKLSIQLTPIRWCQVPVEWPILDLPDHWVHRRKVWNVHVQLWKVDGRLQEAHSMPTAPSPHPAGVHCHDSSEFHKQVLILSDITTLSYSPIITLSDRTAWLYYQITPSVFPLTVRLPPPARALRLMRRPPLVKCSPVTAPTSRPSSSHPTMPWR